MPEAESWSKVRRRVVQLLTDGIKPHGFTQYRTTAYFVRDRGDIRDTFFFQKMRSNSVAIAYGASLAPAGEEWSPGIKVCRWLDNQAFYNVKYEEHAVASMTRALTAFEKEALPWLATINCTADLNRLP